MYYVNFTASLCWVDYKISAEDVLVCIHESNRLETSYIRANPVDNLLPPGLHAPEGSMILNIAHSHEPATKLGIGIPACLLFRIKTFQILYIEW